MMMTAHYGKKIWQFFDQISKIKTIKKKIDKTNENKLESIYLGDKNDYFIHIGWEKESKKNTVPQELVLLFSLFFITIKIEVIVVVIHSP